MPDEPFDDVLDELAEDTDAGALTEAVRRSGLPVAIVDLATLLVVAASDAAAALLGGRPADLRGLPVAGFVADQPTGGVPLLATGRLDGFEAPRRLRRLDGKEVPAYVWVHVLGSRRPARLAAAVLMDARLPIAAGTTEDTWRLIGLVDENWHLERISEEARTVLGWTTEQLAGATVLPAVHPGDVPELLTGMAHVTETGRDVAVRLRVMRADGAYVWTRARLASFDETAGFLFTLRPMAAGLTPSADRVGELERRLARIAAEVRNAGVAAGLANASRGVMHVPPVDEMPGLASLTAREWEVLTDLAQGSRVAAIARHLSLSEGTVRNHLSAIYRKLGVASQAELLHLLRDRADPTAPGSLSS
jgi:PAS domain S-box-containing protein